MHPISSLSLPFSLITHHTDSSAELFISIGVAESVLLMYNRTPLLEVVLVKQSKPSISNSQFWTGYRAFFGSVSVIPIIWYLFECVRSFSSSRLFRRESALVYSILKVLLIFFVGGLLLFISYTCFLVRNLGVLTVVGGPLPSQFLGFLVDLSLSSSIPHSCRLSSSFLPLGLFLLCAPGLLWSYHFSH